MSDPRDQDVPGPNAAGNSPSDDRSAEALLRRFVGRNADAFLKLYEKQRQGKAALSMNWTVFFLGWHTWCFYRKMYLYGIAGVVAVLVATLPLDLISGRAGTIGAIAVHALLATYANAFYVWHARRQVRAIEQHAIPETDRNRMIEKAGGASAAGAAVGVAALVALVGAVFHELANAPSKQVREAGCAADIVHEAALEILVDGMKEQGIATDGVEVGEFVEVAAASPTAIKTCRFIARRPGDSATFFLRIDPLEGDPHGVNFNLLIRPD